MDFFVLSGFVLAHAYGLRLRAGGVGAYLRDRAIRLYPMILLATLPAATAFLARYWVAGVNPPVQQWLTALAAIVPFPAFWRGYTLHAQFPVNLPLWSLFWEILVNIAYAAVAPRLSNRVLIGVIVVFAVALVFATLAMPRGLNHFPGLRAFACFPIGVLLYRVHAAGDRRLARFGSHALPVLLVVLLMPSLGRFDRIFHPAAALLIFPLLVLAAATHAPRNPRLAEWMGRLSYPLYVIHFPVIVAVDALQYHTGLLGVLKLGLALVLAVLAERFFDVPVRAMLRRAFRQRAAGGSSRVPRT